MNDELDPVIHATSRLRIMTTLASVDEGAALSFPRLSEWLGITAGNLSVHLTKLEHAGYVSIEKTFEGRKPVTYAAMTPEGHTAFRSYLDALQRLLAPAEEGK